MDYETDNIIEWIFEKAFDQLTNNGNTIYHIPYENILQQTFHHPEIHSLIHRLTSRNLTLISNYLTNQLFIKKFLLGKTKKRIHTFVILNDLVEVKKLIEFQQEIDEECLLLAALNNRFEMIQSLFSKYQPEMLNLCAEYGHEDLYFYLRGKGILPNLSVYHQAVIGGNMNIIMDINEHVGIMDKLLVTAFQSNHTSVIVYLLKIAQIDKIDISPNLISYPILNNNMELLKIMEEQNHIKWHYELYFSALLSGSLTMIKYVENKLPELHHNHILDTSKIKQGKVSLLLEDLIYYKNNKKYFSHTMNYAIQSKSLEIVKYAHSLGYGITPSNFITAIKQGTVEILEYLCQNYPKKLPFYLIHYFGLNSFSQNKIEKAKILYQYDILSTSFQNLSVNDYKKETTHLDMIGQTEVTDEDNLYDEDYLVKYQLFFVPDTGYKLNHRLISLVRLCLKLEWDHLLLKMIQTSINTHDQLHIIDTLFLFGNINQIKKFHALITTNSPHVVLGSDTNTSLVGPSKPVIMELLCHSQISKICYLLHHHLLTNEIINHLHSVITMLSDHYLNLFFDKLIKSPPKIKYILQSNKKQIIGKWLDENAIILDDIKNIKLLLQMDDLDLLNKIKIDHQLLPKLVSWVKENGLINAYHFLNNQYKLILFET